MPSWVWFNSAMMLAAGAYLWWRLVLGTTRRGTPARWIGTGVAILVGITGPVALIAQYALPIVAPSG